MYPFWILSKLKGSTQLQRSQLFPRCGFSFNSPARIWNVKSCPSLMCNNWNSSKSYSSPRSGTKSPPLPAKLFISIEFEGKSTKFRIPNQTYSFGNLLKDASAYFKVDSTDFVLTDSESIVWPSSGAVIDSLQDEQNLLVTLVRKKPSPVSSSTVLKATKVSSKSTEHKEQERTSTASPKRVHRTSDLKALFSSLEDLLMGTWFRDRMRDRGLDSIRGVAATRYESLVTQFLEGLFGDEQSIESIMYSTLPRMETERKLVDSFEEFARKHQPTFFADYLELPGKGKERINDGSSDAKSKKKEKGAKPLLQLTDLRKPHLWYGAAREMKRKIFLHIGPTNSGKTHSALEALKRAASGVYCGPLRLLAHEIYDRMNKSGIKCDLVTGQVVKKDPDAKHVSCTVEMADLSVVYDCAVIDEYQLLGDASRGWAWTRAFLGLQAREIHLCGNEACEELVLRLAEQCGDEVTVERYQRLAPLKVVAPVTRVGALRPGDCLIAFSRKNIYSLKGIIEENRRDFKCSVVYGSLPPETRTQQARLFNHLSDEYPVLVASDAVGMGLNLNIRRIIFSSMEKFDGYSKRPLTVSEIKQIAGRAGRFKSVYPEGEVTCMEAKDMALLRQAMTSAVDRVVSAGLLPSAEQLEMFAAVAPNLELFSELLAKFLDICRVEKDYFVCDSKDMMTIAQQIDLLPMSIADRYLFCIAPINVDESKCLASLVRWATAHSTGAEVLLNWRPPRIEFLTAKSATKQLQELEVSHNIISSYLWLSMRFSTFTGRTTAQEMRSQCETLIERCLMLINHENPKKFFKKILQTKEEEQKRHEHIVDVDENEEDGRVVSHTGK